MEKPIPAFSKALKHFIDTGKNITQAKIAAKTGVKQSMVSGMKTGKRAGTEDSRRAIAAFFGKEYDEFLKIGERLAEMESTIPDPNVKATTTPHPTPNILIQTHREADKSAIDVDAFTAIPLYESGRMAAFSNGAAFDRYETPSNSVVVYMPELGIRAKHRLAATRVGGDSMEPLIPEGSIIVVDLDDREFADNKIYAVALDDDVDMLFAVKRVRKFEKAEGFLLLSENQSYAPRLVVVHDWHRLCIGRVIWMWRSFEG